MTNAITEGSPRLQARIAGLLYLILIGGLLAIEGLCYLINSFARFLAPAFAARFFPALAASGLAEVTLCLWLLVVGVNSKRWAEQASATAGWT